MGPQGAELMTGRAPVAERVGTCTAPIQLRVGLNISRMAGGVLAATERALTLRNHWLIAADPTWTPFV